MKPQEGLSGWTDRARPFFTANPLKILLCDSATSSYFKQVCGKNWSRADGAGL